MCHCHDLRLFRDLRRNILRREVAVLREIDILESCAARLCNELPRHDVAVMLRDRNDNLVALTNVGASVAVCDKVECLRRILREDDLLGTRCTDELLRPYTRRFIDVRRLHRQLIRAPVWVCIAVGAVVGDRLDDRLRLLRRCTIVKVDNGTPVHLRLQDWEIPQILIIPPLHPKVSSPDNP